MTIYQRALRHFYRMLLGVFAGFVFLVIVDYYFGHSTIAFAICIVVLFVMARDMWRYNCPRCGSNLFMRRWIAAPLPNKTCSSCGLDLTAEE